MSAQVIDLAAWRDAHRPAPTAAPAPPPRCPRRREAIYWPGVITIGLLLGAWLLIAMGAVWLRHR